MCKTAERAVLFTKILAIEEVFWGKHVVWAVVHGGGMGVAVGLQEGKFCITIQKLYCFVSLFQKNILILLLHVCGKRLKRQGSDCTAVGRMRKNFFRLFPLHTLDYKRFTNKKNITIVKNKRHRLQIIVDIIRKTCIGSQSELSDILNQRGVNVTQATLSRDLKSLKITKVANDYGKYMYIIPDSNELQDTMLMKGQRHLSSNSQIGFVSFDYSGNIAIVKTRNGYATGLAYDIDMSHSHIVLGTIAGADTVFVLLREGVSREESNEFFSRFIPAELIEKE